MFKPFRNIYKPEVYHGKKIKNKNFFEGWYFKISDQSQKNIYAIIPGVFKNKKGTNNHSFIQILDSKNNKAHYLKYNFEQFSSSDHKFFVEIDGNTFSKDKIKLDIENENIEINGQLKFSNINSWPIELLSPGAMGWYGFLPFMECNHGVLSFNHKIDGILNINNKNIDFSSGKGYIEKDWGTNFPSSWLWLQSNHFKDDSSSLMVSIATIPWLKSEFRGFIIGFYNKGKLYKFTTYNNSKIVKFIKEKQSIIVEVMNNKYKLIIKTDYSKGTLLKGPYRNEMIKNVEESLDAKIDISLIEIANKKLI
ncbi:MAG: tocopherol cyclase family protein, partial [Bacillota bacterium]